MLPLWGDPMTIENKYNQLTLRSVLGLLILILCLSGKSIVADDNIPTLHVISGQENPYIHINQKGEIVGTYMKVVRDYLKASGIDYKLELLPWPRAYRQLNTRKDTLVFGLTRTPYREERYHWLKLLGEYKQYLITRNTPDMNQLTKEKIITGDYKAICTRGSATCAALVKFGFPKSRLVLTSQLTPNDQVRMLSRGRGDFILGDKAELKLEMIKSGQNIDSIAQLFYVVTMQSYLAAPRHIDPIVLEKLTQTNK